MPAGLTFIITVRGERVNVQSTLIPLIEQTNASLKALLGVVQIPPFQA